jgi:S1-C subfamily serine protease
MPDFTTKRRFFIIRDIHLALIRYTLYIVPDNIENRGFLPRPDRPWSHPSELKNPLFKKIIAPAIIGFGGLSTILIVSILIFVPGRPLGASPSSSIIAGSSLLQYVKQIEPSVVGVDIKNLSGWNQGAGLIVSNDGIVATSLDLIQDASAYEVHNLYGKSWQAQLYAQDPTTDIALLKINAANLPEVNFAQSSQEKVGELTIMLCLTPPSSNLKLFVSKLLMIDSRIILPNGNKILSVDKADVSSNACESNAILLDSSGHVLGIEIKQVKPDGYSLFESSDLLPKVISELIAYKSVRHSFLGVTVEDTEKSSDDISWGTVQSTKITEAPSNVSGVEVEYVYPESPAAKAGIKAGDIITEINGQNTDSVSQLESIIYGTQPGEKITVSIMRSTTPINLTVLLSNGQ